MNYKNERSEVASFMRRLYNRKLTTASGGNISLRVSGKYLLITPSQVDKGRLKWDEVAIAGFNGENFTPDLPLSMETKMHLEIYRKCAGVAAIVHAHPVTASAFTTTRKKINCNLLGEARALLKEPVMAPYALMGTHELAHFVSEAACHSNVVLMANHGVLTTGQSLLQAFDRLEVLEAAAKTTLIAQLIGGQQEIPPSALEQIDSLFA